MLGTFVKVFFRVFIRLIGGILLEGKHQKNVLNLTFGVRFLIFRYPNFEFIDYFFFPGIYDYEKFTQKQLESNFKSGNKGVITTEIDQGK